LPAILPNTDAEALFDALQVRLLPLPPAYVHSCSCPTPPRVVATILPAISLLPPNIPPTILPDYDGRDSRINR